jgi:hypothetical protein
VEGKGEFRGEWRNDWLNLRGMMVMDTVGYWMAGAVGLIQICRVADYLGLCYMYLSGD